MVERLPQNAVIADVATGTGAWLFELTETLPQTTTYVGFDISSKGFPHTHPPNISFEIQDALKPFDSEWHDHFDVIHIRLLLSIMTDETWAVIVRNVVPLLKPGGALVWFEFNTASVQRPLRAGPASLASPSAPVLHRLATLGRRGLGNGRLVDEDEAIANAMRLMALENVVVDYAGTDRLLEFRKPWTRNMLEVMPMVCARLDAVAGKTGALDEANLAKVWEDAIKEVEVGWYLRADGFTVIGFRPEANV